jgi:hypothetical protein
VTSVPPLRDVLRQPDLPLHGTALMPDAFVPFHDGGVAGWHVDSRLREGRAVRVRIWSAESDGDGRPSVDEMRCEVLDRAGSGAPEPLLDPFRRTLGRTAPIQDWYDAVRMQDAARSAVLRDRRRWGGEDLEHMIERSEQGVSEFRMEELAVDTFRSLSELQAWIDRVLAGTQVRAEAFAVRDFPLVDEPRVGQHLLGIEDDEMLGWLPFAASTDQDSGDLFAQLAPYGGLMPQVTLRMSGTSLIGFHADVAQSSEGLQTAGALRTDDGRWPERGEWLALSIVGTAFALPIPARVSNINIGVGDDGATVMIGILPSVDRERHYRRRCEFDRRWGRWLDDDEAISERELDEGVATVERTLSAALETGAPR